MTSVARAGRGVRPWRLVAAALAALSVGVGVGGTSGSTQASAVVHRPGGREVATAASSAGLVVFRTGRVGAEPTLALTQDGVYVTAAELGGTAGADVLHLTDGGKWDVVSPRIGGHNVHRLTLDPYVYADPATERLFTVDLTVACSFLSFSDDGGKAWTTNPLACGRPVNDHQTLFAGPPSVSTTVGYANVVYYCFNDVATSSCSKSLDGGLTFAITGEPAFSPADWEGNCAALTGHGVVGPDGTVYLPKSHCGQPWLGISRDEGLTWERVRVAGNGTPSSDSNPSVAVDSAGNVHYAWIGADRLPYLSVSRDEGRSWSRPLMVGPPGLREANLISLAAGASGRIALAYLGSDDSPYQRCAPSPQCNLPYSDTTWNGYVTTSRTAAARVPLFQTVVVNPARDPLVTGRCGPGRCYPVWDFVDVEIDGRGRPWAAFVDGDDPAVTSGEGLVATVRGGWRLR